jgi:hypothetical protein
MVLGVSSVNAAEQDGERVLATRNGDEMNMVRREAERKNGKKAEVGLAILVGGEGGAPGDAALSDMAGDAGQ